VNRVGEKGNYNRGMKLIWTAADRNLMAKDEFKNLGFGEDEKAVIGGGLVGEEKKAAEEKGVKGELRW